MIELFSGMAGGLIFIARRPNGFKNPKQSKELSLIMMLERNTKCSTADF
jgi:hypothetical protein